MHRISIARGMTILQNSFPDRVHLDIYVIYVIVELSRLVDEEWYDFCSTCATLHRPMVNNSASTDPSPTGVPNRWWSNQMKCNSP